MFTATMRIAVIVGLTAVSEELARDVAMHVAAVNPAVVSSDQMPADVIAAEREIFVAQAARVASLKRLSRK